MIDERTKVVLDICDIKSDMVKSMINKATNGKETREEIEKFINYLNVIVKTNKSKNNLNNRILCLYNSIKDYYSDYKKINLAITKK